MMYLIRKAAMVVSATALIATALLAIGHVPASAQGDDCVPASLRINDGDADVFGQWRRGDCLGDWFGRSLWVDLHLFQLTALTQVDLELSSNERIPALVLVAEGGELIATRSGTSSQRSTAISTRLAAGSYHIGATKRDSGTGSYRLQGTFTAIGGGDEPPPSPREIRSVLARALFGPSKVTNHEYNLYGANPGSGCQGYDNGHSGWDAQTQSVAGAVPTKNEPFYSLSAGTVIRVGGVLNLIAVYDATANLTTLYLHARSVDVRVGQRVNVGTRLGIQGNAGLSTDPTDREHVHVEVRRGRRIYAACGASTSISPYEYLYQQVMAARS